MEVGEEGRSGCAHLSGKLAGMGGLGGLRGWEGRGELTQGFAAVTQPAPCLSRNANERELRVPTLGRAPK